MSNLDLLRGIPVSVNNYYGDPTLQWDGTMTTAKDLLSTGHHGPVGIITKGKLSKKHVLDIGHLQNEGLRLVVLVSISELGGDEKVGHKHRYRNIAMLSDNNIPHIAYIRPLIPPYNTSPQVLTYIFSSLKRAGCQAVCASGFRGDDAIIATMSPAETMSWTMRVKLMSGDVYSTLLSLSMKTNIPLFSRTSCAVSYCIKMESDYNPYHNSPNLAKCSACPLIHTCNPKTLPNEGSLDLLREFGYEVEFVHKEDEQRCFITPNNRLSCPSCCTTCYVLKTNRVVVHNARHLGDLSFARFLTGILSVKDGFRDDGSQEVGKVTLPRFEALNNLQCLNSWWPIATKLKKCFSCRYCIEKHFNKGHSMIGINPSSLINLL